MRGGVIGLLVAVGVARAVNAVPFGLASALLFGMSPWDPASFARVSTCARRSQQYDPLNYGPTVS